MKWICFIFFLILSYAEVFSQNDVAIPFMPDDLKKVVIIQPTGEKVNDLPEMTILADTTELHKTVMKNINNSFINEFLELYFIAQIYLKNKHKLDNIEPVYLALTENQGGFAKFGFSIKQGGKHITKPHAAYVDITVGRATQTPNKLMSFTQLYPHETGHVLFHLLSPEDTVANNTKNVDMHFFSIVTDYSTAFNEGFAEHIENVSRVLEKNESIKQGILVDIQSIGNSSKQSIRGFKRDFIYPFRLGYYKASMLNWYQKYEDYKRYEQAISGDIRYKNAVLASSNIEDQLTYRNSGVELNKSELRNYVQLLSTEGAISSFFTQLSTSELSNHYLDFTFYRPFLYDTVTITQSPEELFNPIQNQFIKYFTVLHNYVVFNNSSKSQLTDFIDGYIQEFPSEEGVVKKIFQKALGKEYSNDLPPPLWVLVKDRSHRLLVFDPFDAITVPVYTFDLNAAEIEDFQTIDGISKNDAEKIVRYRNKHGYFTDWGQLKMIPDLPIESSNKIISSAFDNDYFEKTLEDFEPKLSIGTLVANPLKYIFSRAIIYFVFLFGMIYFLSIRQKRPTTKQMTLLFIKYLLLWTMFVLAGLMTVFLAKLNAYLYFMLFSALLALITLAVYRKRKVKKHRTLVFIGSMFLLVLISVV